MNDGVRTAHGIKQRLLVECRSGDDLWRAFQPSIPGQTMLFVGRQQAAYRVIFFHQPCNDMTSDETGGSGDEYHKKLFSLCGVFFVGSVKWCSEHAIIGQQNARWQDYRAIITYKGLMQTDIHGLGDGGVFGNTLKIAA